MDREIQEKQSKIDYVQTCANYLLSKTVDARGLSINMNELTKFCQQLRNLTKRIQKLKRNLTNTSPSRYDALVADFEDLLLQINADFRSKEEALRSPTPVGVQIESLPADFNYGRIFTSTRRKIDALHELIHQMKQDLRDDSVVLGESFSRTW